MKKFLAVVAALLVGSAVFAQSSKELFLGTYDFAKESSDLWRIYDGIFSKLDMIGEEYTFTGGFVVKNIVGHVRYDFTCNVKNDNSDFSLTLSDMVSYNCDKNGSKAKSAKEMTTSAKVAKEYEKQMKDEIKARMGKFADNLDESFLKVISLPENVYVISNSMSDLAVSKFFENNLNGKKVSFEVTLDSIDENKNPITKEVMPLAYKATGSVQVLSKTTVAFAPVIAEKPYFVFIYSNNDKLLTTKVGSKYTVNGTAKITPLNVGLEKRWSYSVDEE